MREADLDAKDRNKEQEELEELKNKIFSGEFENPTQEYERAKKEHEKLYKPQIIIDVNMENIQRKEREQERNRDKVQVNASKHHNSEELYDDGGGGVCGNDTGVGLRSINKAHSIESISNEDDDASRHDTISNASSRYSRQGSESRDYMTARDVESMSPATPQGFTTSHAQNEAVSTPPITGTTVISLNLGANAKKKRIESTAGVFNNDEDNDDVSSPKKRKLVPLGRLVTLRIMFNLMNLKFRLR